MEWFPALACTFRRHGERGREREGGRGGLQGGRGGLQGGRGGLQGGRGGMRDSREELESGRGGREGEGKERERIVDR